MWDVPVFVRGGRIVPLYETPGEATFATISTPLTLLIAGDQQGNAEGYFYMDDGLSYSFQSGEYVHRRFRLKDGLVSAEKINGRAERAVPAALENAFITAFTFYLIKPDGTANVTHVTGLHLLVKDEWTWRVYEPVEGGVLDGSGKLGVVLLVIGGVTGVCLISVLVAFVVVIVRRNKGAKETGLQKELTRYV
jgi:hypothetical protein